MTQRDPSDDILVKDLQSAAQAVKESAFEVFFNRYYKKVCGYIAQNKGLSHDEVENCAQETFIAIWKNIHTFEGQSKLSTWVFGCARNKAKEFCRSKNRKKNSGIPLTKKLEDSLEDPSQDVFEHVGARERLYGLINSEGVMFGDLLGTQKMTMDCLCLEGLSQVELAAQLNLPSGTIKSRVHRARKELAEWDSKPLALQP